MSGTLREPAPAKVNLTLAVTGRRDDGYHLLDTLVAFCETGDTLVAAPADELSLTLEGRFAAALEPNSANLVLRAAHLLAEEARRTGREVGGARLHLIKEIPVAAGLGGGSADAAATLRALNRLWRLGDEPGQLAALGSRLGADVAMCVYSQPLQARGIGDEITLLDPLPPLPMVLANPGIPLATGEIFAARRFGFSPPLPAPIAFATPAALVEWLRPLGNDLEAPAKRLAPIIGEVLSGLRRASGCLLARLSGSGATCFAIFSDHAAASRAAATLAAARPGWWVQATTGQ